MREADMKCKVALWRFPSLRNEAAPRAISAQATRGRKLAAEKSLGPNVSNEIAHFALGDSFAHITPISLDLEIVSNLRPKKIWLKVRTIYQKGANSYYFVIWEIPL